MNLSQDKLRALLGETGHPCLSLYMPTIRAGAETQQNPTRFKNLLRSAEERSQGQGLSKAEVQTFLEPLRKLQDDPLFWQHQDEGLAVFRAPAFFVYHRLPRSFPELVMVEDRFYLKPLFPLLGGRGRFYVLALSQKEVRLVEADRFSAREVELGKGFPRSLNDALGYEVSEKHLQLHSTAKGGGAPVYHGQGGGEDDVKGEVRKFFNLVENQLQGLLPDRRAPVVLAGVDYLLPIFREVNGNGHLQVMDEGISGNPESLGAEELQRLAWPLVEPLLRQHEEQAADSFRQRVGTGQASAQIEEVVAAAHDGRVDTLFIAEGARQWGSFDPQTRRVETHSEEGPHSEDLLDQAAVETLMHGGTVFAVPPDKVPADGPAAAVFRY